MISFIWSDILDVLLVAGLIYWLLVWFQGSRAVQLLRGIGIFVLIFVAAHLFQLRTVLWLFDRFGTIIVIMVILAFQPEVRRALERFGRESQIVERILGKRPPGFDSVVVSHISRALEQLSQNKVGALIVMERGVLLEEFVESGTRLDAELSSELLISIFDTKGPLHDGAVIVRGGRAIAAGCLLPLSSENLPNKRLATRHRSAVGITEETDALVLVASEETGEIRVAEHGTLSPPLTMENLQTELFEFFRGDK